jgi:hypothetical protein
MQGPQIDLENPDRMGFWRYIWMYWLAALRLNKHAVCVMSSTKGVVDFHDYPDDEHGFPDHFTTLKCKRCGKEFII